MLLHSDGMVRHGIGLDKADGTAPFQGAQSRRSTGFSRKSTRAFRPTKPFFLKGVIGTGLKPLNHFRLQAVRRLWQLGGIFTCNLALLASWQFITCVRLAGTASPYLCWRASAVASPHLDDNR